MTKAGFIRQNQGIASGRDLSDDYIGGIYDRIRANAISLREDDDAREKVKGGRPAYAMRRLGLPPGVELTEEEKEAEAALTQGGTYTTITYFTLLYYTNYTNYTIL